jgi:5-methylcytosine-specific restriction endonuclease McrA
MVSKQKRAENYEHYAEYDRKWRAANPERVLAKQQRWLAKNPTQNKQYRKELRLQAIQCLGGVCARCQFVDIRCLQIDHITPLGKPNGRNSVRLYLDVIKGHTENLQLLCANCHMIKTYEEDNSSA